MMQCVHPTGVAAIKQDPSGEHLVPPPPEQRLECRGHAKEALEIYKKRVKDLDASGQRKSDMVACRELKGLVRERTHGELPGVPGGLLLKSRGEAAITGIHQRILRGIDYVSGDPAYAVCISGEYEDDVASDGTITYTGEGGQGKGKKKAQDQTDSSPGNQALIRSIDSQDTIRVIRGNSDIGYYYLGLYRCTGYTYKPGECGFKVLKFNLVPIMENQCPWERSIPLRKRPRKKTHPLRAKVEVASPLSKNRLLAKASALKPKPLRIRVKMPKQEPLENVYAPPPPRPEPMFHENWMGKQEGTAGAEEGGKTSHHMVKQEESNLVKEAEIQAAVATTNDVDPFKIPRKKRPIEKPTADTSAVPKKKKAPSRGSSLIGHQEETVLGGQSHSNFKVSGVMTQMVRKDPRLVDERA